MIAVADILVHFRVSRHGHPIGRRDETITRIVIERHPVSENERFALHSIHCRKAIDGKGEIGAAFLQTHVAETLANGNLSDFIRVDSESPVRPHFTRRVIRFVLHGRRLP